jgi:uncharacterized SAM-binding protein YcdF (DUF218 family)
MLITLLRSLLLASALLLALLGIGFILFANSIELGQSREDAKADGIVVLTGGEARIDRAVNLLSEGRAKRLLISGVHPSTTSSQLRRRYPKAGALFQCCIDLDKQALNTTGNAAETQAWAQRLHFNSLIVVTSSYHMPRTLLELRRAMPNVELIPYPVVPRNMNIANWWTDSETTRLLFVEYVKLIPALARYGLTQLLGARPGDRNTRAAASTP